MQEIHPVYGAYELGWKTIDGFDNYEVNETCHVRNKKSKKHLQPNPRQQVTLCNKGEKRSCLVYQLCLRTFFPSLAETGPKTVDHINENHQDNQIENLQWLSRSENTRKSLYIQYRSNALKRSKEVQQFDMNGHLIATYPSEASRQTGISQARISEYCTGKANCPMQTNWKYSTHSDLPQEQWKTNDDLIYLLQNRFNWNREVAEKVLVSNMGRIQTVKGIKTKGVKCTDSSYRNYRGLYVHRLVYLVWGNDKITDSLKVLHDDDIDLDEEGCCLNAVCHLRLGSQNENMQSWHRSKKRKRMSL